MCKESFGPGQPELPDPDPEAPHSSLFCCLGRSKTNPPEAQPGSVCAPIIAHCHLRWDFVWQRPQQIFSRLAKHQHILFIEEPKRDGNVHRLAISAPYPNVVRIVLILKNGTAQGVDTACDLLLSLLQGAMQAHPLLKEHFESPVQWFCSPMPAPHMLGQFNASRVVYDCMDELPSFRFAPPDISRREQLLLLKADVVFTGGYQLYQSKSRHHPNVHFYGCGVNVDHYGKARLDATELPAAVAHLPHPIFGFFGIIDERLDYELPVQLADAFLQASIVMAGPQAKAEEKDLPPQSNNHWLGQQAYEDLPALAKAFDVCLMPFALNKATQFINPTKALEYMAAGKPIVSTALPDVLHIFTPVVGVARSPQGIISAVRNAWLTPDQKLIHQGIARANHATWEAIISAMRGHLGFPKKCLAREQG